jgi:hypothetical protein
MTSSKNPASWLSLVSLVLSFFLHVPATFAGEPGVQGVNLDIYRPAVDGFGVYGVNSPETLPGGGFSIQAGTHLAHGRMFQVATAGGPATLLETLFTGNLVGSVGFTSWLSGGFALPYHFSVRGDNVTTLASYGESEMGDLSAHLKFKLIDEDKSGVGLALIGGTDFPTGSDRHLVGSRAVTPFVHAVVGKHFTHANLFAQVGARFPQKTSILGVTFDDRLTFGAAMEVPVRFIAKGMSLEAEVQGAIQPAGVNNLTSPVGFMSGLKQSFTNGLFVKAGAGAGFNSAIGNPRLQASLDVGMVLKPKKDRGTAKSYAREWTVHFKKNTSVLAPDASVTLADFPDAGRSDRKARVQIVLSRPIRDALIQKRMRVLENWIKAKGYDVSQIVSETIAWDEPSRKMRRPTAKIILESKKPF